MPAAGADSSMFDYLGAAGVPLSWEFAPMLRPFRGPLAAVSFGLGAAGATLAVSQLQGQPPVIAANPGVAADPFSYRDVVKRVVPAVVSIEAKGAAERPRRAAALPPGVPEEFRRFFEAPGGPGGRPDTDLGFGSGFVIDPAGVILTNFHVVDGAESVEVTFADGRKFTSKDIRKDAKTDLAIVKVVSDKPLPSLEFGDSDAAEVGDRVLAVGAPFGLTGSVTHGIVSAKSRHNLRLNQYEDFLQTDAAVNPGNSGGPLVGLDGRVLGITSAIKSRSGGFQGVGLAISSGLARDVAAQLLKDGAVRRGYLGVDIRNLDDALANRLGVAKGTGVVISRVYDNSPAAKSGLQAGDVVTAVAGTPVTGTDNLPRLVAKLKVGQPAAVTYVRDGKPATLNVTVEEQPERLTARSAPATTREEPAATDVGRYGLSVTDVTPKLAARFGYPANTRGVVVTSAEPGGPAAAAGLGAGQVITKVDKQAVGSAQEFADAVGAAPADRGALLYLLRPTGEVDFVVLKPKQ